MEDILKNFNELADRFNGLHTENIENMEIAEIENTIDEIQKLSEAAKALNEAARKIEADGEYDIDELNQFYRDYLDFQDLLYDTSINLGRRREVERQALSAQLSALRDARVDALRYERELAAKMDERQEALDRIEEMSNELDFHNRLAEGIETILKNSENLNAEATKSLESKMFENQKDIDRLQAELEELKAKDQSLAAEIEALQQSLDEAVEKMNTMNAQIEEYKGRQDRIHEEPTLEEEEEQTRESDGPGASDFDSSSGSSSSSTEGTSTTSDSTSESSAATEEEDEEKEYLPINGNEQTVTIDGKVYIVELDEEATMRNYDNAGYGKNAFGWYFDPSTDEYVEGYDPLQDPLFQIFDYYEVVNVLDEDATMQNYRNSGYDKNAFGWYFDPSTDEYVEGYDPLKDPLFQVYKEQKVYIGKGEPNKVPTKQEPGKDNPDKGKPGNGKPDGGKPGSPKGGEKSGTDFDDLGIPVIELPEDEPNKDPEVEKVNVTMNIRGPEDKETSVVVQVTKGQTLFQDPLNKTIFKNACLEVFGQAAGYSAESITCDGKPFDLNTPINEEKTINFVVKRQFKVTFVDENNVVKEVYVNEGEYLDPNMVELVSNQVNYANKDATYLGEQKNKNKGWKLEKAMTGLRYWGVQNEEGKTEKFKFDQPITGNVVLNAKKGIKGKSVAAGLSGVAVGAALDVAAGPLAGRVAGIAAGAVDRIAKYKLNHRKEMIGYDEIAQMTGVKKASAKIKNHFRKNQTIKNIQYFCRGVMLGVAGAEVSKFVGAQVDKMFPEKTYSSEPIHIENVEHKPISGTPRPAEPQYSLKSGDQFEYGFRDSYNAVGNTNSVHLDQALTGQSHGAQLYDTVGRQWLPVDQQTLAEAALDKGRYAVRYMSENGDMMWESLEEALEMTGGMAR